MSKLRTAAMLMMCGVDDPNAWWLTKLLSSFSEMSVPLAQYPLVEQLFDMKGWSVSQNSPIILQHEDGTKLTLDRNHAQILFREMLDWERCYLPNFSLQGKTVLDIGAGCGETAAFYFQHGAKQVIAIEQDESCREYLERNRALNGWPMLIIDKPFRLEDLEIPHDFLKMDIEGGEIVLLHKQAPLCPCLIELHPRRIGQRMAIKLALEYGLERVERDVWRC